jgi:hypothetical protein
MTSESSFRRLNNSFGKINALTIPLQLYGSSAGYHWLVKSGPMVVQVFVPQHVNKLEEGPCDVRRVFCYPT